MIFEYLHLYIEMDGIKPMLYWLYCAYILFKHISRWWKRARNGCLHYFADKTALCRKILWGAVTLPLLIHSIFCTAATIQSTQSASCLQGLVYVLCIQYMNGHEIWVCCLCTKMSSKMVLKGSPGAFSSVFVGSSGFGFCSLVLLGSLSLACICCLCSSCHAWLLTV